MAAERASRTACVFGCGLDGRDTALKAVEAAKEAGVLDKLVIVAAQSRGVQKMAPETLQMLKELACPLCAQHTFCRARSAEFRQRWAARTR